VESCDVLILGSGLAGSITGAVLARQGARVVLVDAGQHPRFAVGESMTSQLVEWLHILAARFDVPEIDHLADSRSVAEHIGPVHGQKANFGFVRQVPGQEPDPAEATMFVIPKATARASHLFRQDCDQYFFTIATRYGCVTKQNWRARDVDLDEDGVTVTGVDGTAVRARYLIDASGFRSPLADKLQLREEPSRFKHHARSLFNHYVGVRPYDEVSRQPEELRPPVPWHSGTLHHLIDRGWFWIIPFDNVEGSRNLLCSVGLTMDERTYPKPADLTPAQEFQAFLDRYPAVARQFEGARPVREWVSTGRLQYSSTRSVGHRWCLMSHAAGFLDPLYSRGLSNTFEVVHALSTRVLAALEDDDWSTERFGYVEELERGLLAWNDDLVNSSYIAFSHFRLWNAMFRVWSSFITNAAMRLQLARARYDLDGDPRHFDALETRTYPGLWWPQPDLAALMRTATSTCERYEAGEIDGDKAADIIFEALRDTPSLSPVLGFKDPESRRYIHPTQKDLLKFVDWSARRSPDPVSRQVSRDLLLARVKAKLPGRK
jgi:tetracycline 7-halogenase / FADH2 O2-dependent halogenase